MANITTSEFNNAEKAVAVAVCSSIPWAKVIKYITPKAESYAGKLGKAISAKLSKSGGCFSGCCGSLTTCIPGLSPTNSGTGTNGNDASSFIDYPNPFKEPAKTSTGTTKSAAAARFRSSSRRSSRVPTVPMVPAAGVTTATPSLKAASTSPYSNPVSPRSTSRTTVNRATVRSAIYAPSAFDPEAIHEV